MDDYRGRVLAGRYRLPQSASAEDELFETRALDTASGQEVVVHQVPLPEVVDAELLEDGASGADPDARGRVGFDPQVVRALEAAEAAAAIPDHPRLDQVFDVFEEYGSLWIVSELVPARPLAALLAERTLSPYRGAEVAADILTALRALHAYGWTHRNITARTVLVCDDGRIVLTGLALGAAQDALCGYDPLPPPPGWGESPRPQGSPGPPPGAAQPPPAVTGPVPRLPEGFQPARVPAQASPPADRHGGGTGQQAAAHHRAQGGPAAGGGPAGGGPAGGGPAGSGPAGSGPAGGGPAGRPAGARPGWPESALGGGPGQGAGTQRYDGDGDGGGPGRAALAAARGEDGTRPADRGRTGAIAAYRSGTQAAAARIAGGGPAYTDRIGVGDGTGGRDGGRRAEDGGWPAEDGGRADGSPYPPDVSSPYPADTGSPYAADAGVPYSSDAHVPYSSDAHVPYPSDATAPYPPGADDPSDPAGPDAPAGSPYQQGANTPAHRPDHPAISTTAPLPATGAVTVPGAAGYGGSLPGPLKSGGPRASIAVPLTKAPDDTPDPGEAEPHHAYRGPVTQLGAERARHARMTVVGAVTERWAPEQAGALHEHWQLAPPIGPATDLWALGALLFRAVQGHPAYPEENVAELVQLVCSEPSAMAEECGALRPVVESLLRQDPTERPDFEELRGWLRSLIRTAPEPDVGSRTVTVPPLVPGRRGRVLGPGRASDPRKLPVPRRRGELVRRRRVQDPVAVHGRHKRGTGPPRRRGPLSLGRTLIAVVFVLMAGLIAYAALFMPKSGAGGSGRQKESIVGGAPGGEPSAQPSHTGKPQQTEGKKAHESATAPARPDPADLPKGFVLRKDGAGFEVAVDKDWRRYGQNDRGQVRYVGGDYELLVVPGRDTVKKFGKSPMDYQQDKEPELTAYRNSDGWSSASGLRSIDVGDRAMAEGEYTWKDSSGRSVHARNLAMIIDGRYHVLMVVGPDSHRREISLYFQQAVNAYRATK